MPFLIQCQKLSKSYRSRPLFENLSVSIEEGERLGIVGPNGAGKSTLMKIICGQVQPDDGKLISSKGLRVCYLPQEDEFDEKQVGQVLSKAAQILRLESHELTNRVEKIITQFDFPGPEQEVASLSGGWRKRLALARELIKEPELLLLDEPTNHLDLETVIWLEKFLLQSRFSLMLITHDRQFLENVSTRIVEINPLYENGCLSVDGKYSDFLMAKDEYMRAQNHLEQALASKVRKEVAWLQRGARARQTKSVHRIREAGVLMDNFAEVKGRNTLNTKIDIDFDATNRKTKELLVAKGIEKSMGGRKLFSKLDLLLCPGTRIGLLGANGSGKTTLLKLLTGDLEPDKGSIKRADRLRVVWFDQNREQLDLTKTLWKSLCPDGDSVVYRDKSTHVSTWARRFLFKQDQLHMPINFLSGGEQARILIANLMKQPADLLILDEPTNNLDLPSLEVLEESLLEFPGAVILVTHDRYMNMTVPNLILALDGEGGTNYFADLNQWEVFQDDSAGGTSAKSRRAAGGPGLGSVGRALDGDGSGGGASDSGPKRPALSTSEKKELLEMAEKIEKAEAAVSKLQKELEDPQHGSNHETLIKIQKDLDKAHKAVEKLYKRWEDLELRQA